MQKLVTLPINAFYELHSSSGTQKLVLLNPNRQYSQVGLEIDDDSGQSNENLAPNRLVIAVTDKIEKVLSMHQLNEMTNMIDDINMHLQYIDYSDIPNSKDDIQNIYNYLICVYIMYANFAKDKSQCSSYKGSNRHSIDFAKVLDIPTMNQIFEMISSLRLFLTRNTGISSDELQALRQTWRLTFPSITTDLIPLLESEN